MQIYLSSLKKVNLAVIQLKHFLLLWIWFINERTQCLFIGLICQVLSLMQVSWTCYLATALFNWKVAYYNLWKVAEAVCPADSPHDAMQAGENTTNPLSIHVIRRRIIEGDDYTLSYLMGLKSVIQWISLTIYLMIHLSQWNWMLVCFSQSNWLFQFMSIRLADCAC